MIDRTPSAPEPTALVLESGRLDLATGEFVGASGETTLLAPRPLELLRHLVHRAGDVVGRDEILAEVWGHIEAGSDDAVNITISSLRKLLGDHGRPFRVIQTVPRRGYRYVGPTPVVAERAREHAGEPEASTASHTPGRRIALLAGLALAITVLGVVFTRLAPEPGGLERLQAAPSIAVLPFLDLSERADTAFADGLVDTVLHKLAQVPGLRVIARTSTFSLRDSKASAVELGEQLGAGHILEGSVQRADDRLRIITQLIDARDGSHVWSRTYDREVGALFDIQDDIAAEVSRALSRTLLNPAAAPRDLAYFEQIALGQHELDKETSVGAAQARVHFEHALELEPHEPEAMLKLAAAISQEAGLNGWPRDERFDRYRSLIERANELAPNDAVAVAALGRLRFRLGDREDAEALFARSIELNPNFVEGHLQLGRTLWRRGAFDEALERLQVARRLDPLSDLVNAFLADAYWSVGRAEEALARLRENIGRNPDYPRNYDRMATYLNQLGRTGESMRYIEKQRDLDPGSGIRVFRVCEFYLQIADDARAEECTDAFELSHDMPNRLLYLRQIIAGFRGDWERQRALLLELHERFPQMELIPVLIAMSHSAVDCPLALDVLRNAYPSMFEAEPTFQPMYTLGAQMAVHCLRQQGDVGKAERLLAAVDSVLERTRIARGPHYMSGIEGAVQLALSGRHDAAIAEIERMVRNGWRYYWWGLETYAPFQPILDDPRFVAAMRDLREGVDEQRAEYEARRDEPLIAVR